MADIMDGLILELYEARQRIAELAELIDHLRALYEEEESESEAKDKRIAELEAALRPFAQVLARYTLDDSDIIRLADDFSGKPMNIMTAEAFNRARAALKEKADG